MKYKTYIKNRGLFESRFKPFDDPVLKNSIIQRMSKGIRNFDLFFAIYCADKRPITYCKVWALDKPYKTYINSTNGKVCRRIQKPARKGLFTDREDWYLKAIDGIKRSLEIHKSNAIYH